VEAVVVTLQLNEHEADLVTQAVDHELRMLEIMLEHSEAAFDGNAEALANATAAANSLYCVLERLIADEDDTCVPVGALH
jgi:hypothetical protein